jgi:Zn-dependent protease with chaperone function
MNSFFLLHGLTLALVWFLGVNAVATLLVVALAARLTWHDRIRTPRFWLCLRLLPAAVSIVAVIVVFLPSYWTYEPRDYDEGFNFTLVAAAVVAFTLVARAVARGAAAWVRASNRARAWLQNAQPLTLPWTPLPAFAVEAEAPFVALVGVLRPRLFITRSVVDALTEEELAAGLGHEVGHWRALDNLKRLAMRMAPDFLAGTVARDLERRWASSAEHWADRHACEATTVVDRGRARCALASAIVKVARMAPAMVMTEPISTLVDGGDIALRVRTLLDDAAPPAPPRSRRVSIGAGIVVAALVVGYAPLLEAVHVATEIVVDALP